MILEKGPVMQRRRLNNAPGSTPGAVRALIQKGILNETQKEVLRSPIKAAPKTRKSVPVLTAAQDKAVTAIIRSLEQESPKPFLLHGVTASGKTEVYMLSLIHI